VHTLSSVDGIDLPGLGLPLERLPDTTKPLARGERRRSGFVVIDESPLRRASTVELLRTLVRETAVTFGSAAELAARAAAAAAEFACILVNVGGRSLLEVGVAAELRRLTGLVTPMVVLSGRDGLDEIAAAFRLGARGFIPTSLEPRVAAEAIRMVRAGGSFFPAAALAELRQGWPLAVEDRGTESAPSALGGHWPPRQLSVLRLLVGGRANKEIARELRMEESTVKVHVWRIMKKLNAANRTEAALRARRLGILPAGGGQTDQQPFADLTSMASPTVRPIVQPAS